MEKGNGGKSLDVIERIKQNPDFQGLDEYIKFQIGHATHVTLTQAIRMQKLGVLADVCLSSNAATGAIHVHLKNDDDDIFITRGDLNGRAHKPAFVVRTSAAVAEAYAQHSMVKLLLAGVKVVLGTDGAGVEHSDNAQDFDVQWAMLHHFVGFQDKEGESEIAQCAQRVHKELADSPDSHELERRDTILQAMIAEYKELRKIIENEQTRSQLKGVHGESKAMVRPEVVLQNQQWLYRWMATR